MSPPFALTASISASEQERVTEIIYEAFARKYAYIIPERRAALDLIRTSCRYDCALYGLSSGPDAAPVAILGYSTGDSNFFRLLRYRDIRRHFGPLRSLFLYLVLNGERRQRIRPDELKIELLAVEKEVRGSGLGTILIEQAERLARERGLLLLTLDVVDTNTGAQNLYRRVGFREVKRRHFGCITRRAGFTASIKMNKEIDKQ